MEQFLHCWKRLYKADYSYFFFTKHKTLTFFAIWFQFPTVRFYLRWRTYSWVTSLILLYLLPLAPSHQEGTVLEEATQVRRLCSCKCQVLTFVLTQHWWYWQGAGQKTQMTSPRSLSDSVPLLPSSETSYPCFSSSMVCSALMLAQMALWRIYRFSKGSACRKKKQRWRAAHLQRHNQLPPLP